MGKDQGTLIVLERRRTLYDGWGMDQGTRNNTGEEDLLQGLGEGPRDPESTGEKEDPLRGLMERPEQVQKYCDENEETVIC